jgi:N-acetylglucosaminyl-diphospho-decaprenol L-rhamnosyltransferase
VSVVVLTHDRAAECLGTLQRLQELPDEFELVVVDNASTDGTAGRVRERFPGVRVIESPTNLGAAGRNLGVAAASAPYVAFCDDDCWWEGGSLTRAAELLDAYPHVAAM